MSGLWSFRADFLKSFIVFLGASAPLFAEPVSAQPAPEVYVADPDMHSLELSADGSLLAGIMDVGDKEALCVFRLDTRARNCLLDVTGKQVGRLSFPDQDKLVFISSENTDVFGYSGRFQYSAAFAVDLNDAKPRQLLQKTERLYPAQGGLGRILAISEDSRYAFMPAYTQRGGRSSISSAQPSYDLYKVSFDTGRGIVMRTGQDTTINWFVTPDGEPIARENFDDDSDMYAIEVFRNGRWEAIHSELASRVPFNLIGTTEDQTQLVAVSGLGEEDDAEAVFFINLADGSMSEPAYRREGLEIDHVIVNDDRVVVGVQYSGASPSYKMFDDELDQKIAALVKRFPGNNVYLDSWSEDWSTVLVFVTGGQLSGSYVVFDLNTEDVKFSAHTRPQLTPELVAPTAAIPYPARDGLMIPSVVTFPLGVDLATTGPLPTIILPHGGPASYDNLDFDWMSQLFASRGYLVLQPNFRGSTGFGSTFRQAGKGEWGKAMQDDVTDGLNLLLEEGLADPDRVCIVGWSYGGYAALAGGAFTPDKYSCVVSIAGVSDLPRMLYDEKRDHGKRNWVYEYWTEQTGADVSGRAEIEAISPVNHAAAFQAPVLLIHGTDDLIVDERQSRRMEEALKEAGKSVKRVVLKDQDHSLSTPEDRMEAFSEVLAFVKASIGE